MFAVPLRPMKPQTPAQHLLHGAVSLLPAHDRPQQVQLPPHGLGHDQTCRVAKRIPPNLECARLRPETEQTRVHLKEI